MIDPLSDLREARNREDLLGVSVEARRLIEAQAQLGSQWGDVAGLAMEVGDEVAALKAAELLTRASPNYPQSWLWLASALTGLGRHQQALEVIERLIAQAPNDPALQRRAGRALLELGRTNLAELSFRRAISLDRFDVLAWEGLAECITFESGTAELAALEEMRLQNTANMSSTERGALAYTLAKAYRDVGEAAVAAMRVAEGAAFCRDDTGFDTERHELSVKALIASYEPQFVDKHEDAGVIDGRPVLIMAPPCAGADWLGDVLAADDQAGALMRGNSLFWLNSAPLGDQTLSEISEAIEAGWGRNVLGDVGKRYLAQAEEALGHAATRIIDPSSLSEMAAGAFGVCLPAAKMIRIVRDPRDLAWSIYKTRFRKARHWTYHPDDIARVLACHNRLCEHWETIFPGRVHTVRYEDLLADPQATVREAAAFIGVDADAAAAEAWLRSEGLKNDPEGVHAEAGDRFEPLEAALARAGLVDAG
jgi:tetratricopeptide (TPR) repeat protein